MKKEYIIVGVIILLAVYYFVVKGSQQNAPSGGPSTPGGAQPPITPGAQSGAASTTVPGLPPGLPAMSNPALVSSPAQQSLPAPQSLATDVVTPLPVAVTANPSIFIANTPSAQQEGNAAQAATPAISSPYAAYPSGFQIWANSLGPQNQAHLKNVLPSMSVTDVNFINNVQSNNLWGQPSVAAQWNAFCNKYGFPVNLRFSNFN